MTVKEIRKKAKMSQSEFSRYFGINIGNIHNWEQGICKPPDYLCDLLLKILKYEGIITDDRA